MITKPQLPLWCSLCMAYSEPYKKELKASPGLWSFSPILLQGCNPVSYSCTGLWCKILKTLDFPKNTVLKGGISGIAFFLLLTQKDLSIHGQAVWDSDKTIRDCSVPVEDSEPPCSRAGINHSSYFHKAEIQQKRGTGHGENSRLNSLLQFSWVAFFPTKEQGKNSFYHQ